ncbi:UNVERIFIED_ORG: hypothetical protein J2791_001810 [Burkholderia contaminans]|nr:hypothetical protein [Burkholderia contaminans]
MIRPLQGGLNKGLDRLVDQVTELLGTAGADVVVRELVDDLRAMMAADLRSLLEDGVA